MINELGSVKSFVKRAAQQTGFERERYIEADVPEDFSKVIVICFFGDFRSEAILSSLLLHQYIKHFLTDKYVILCSWQGHAGLFPYVNEYWSPGEQMVLQNLYDGAIKFNNTNKIFETITKNLRKFFDVLTWDDLSDYYSDGLTKKFFDHFGEPLRFLPAIPSPKIEFLKDLRSRNAKTVFIYPNKTLRAWNKREVNVAVDYLFWKNLVEKILQNEKIPVVYQNFSTYDVSRDFGDKCLYVTDNNILSLMSQMRATTCVLDVFSGISRLAMLARCPFISVDERNRYVLSKEFEINDLCIDNFNYRYVLSFSAILQHGNYKEITDHILNVIKDFGEIELPSSLESYNIVPYSKVRRHKAKKLGVHFIKVERLLI